MNSLPGPSRSTSIDRPSGRAGGFKGILLKTRNLLTVTPKISVADTFTNLNNWTTVYGTPAAAGTLTGTGVVRHKTPALTDSHKAAAVISALNTGTTRLVICGDPAFVRYYALEVNKGLSTTFSIIKGNGASSVESRGILGLILDLLFGLFSLFSPDTSKFATTTVTLTAGDAVSIWYDEPNTTIRCYKNASQVCSLPVPRGEIPHGAGYRNHGVAVGVSGTGTIFTSYTAVDV